MNEEIKAIADRLKGLREIHDVTVEEAAAVCNITPEQYAAYESGNADIPIGLLQCMAKKYDIDFTILLSGKEPHMTSYFLTKKGRGIAVDRRVDYKYQSLAYGFINRKAEPFFVTVTPEATKEIHFNSHPGHEFDYVLSGTLRIVVDGRELILEEGDSLYFDSGKPHGMQAVNDKEAQFLAIVF